MPSKCDTIELCKELVTMAAFVDNTRVRDKIYKAVRQLQLLDKIAIEAGLFNHCPCPSRFGGQKVGSVSPLADLRFLVGQESSVNL